MQGRTLLTTASPDGTGCWDPDTVFSAFDPQSDNGRYFTDQETVLERFGELPGATQIQRPRWCAVPQPVLLLLNVLSLSRLSASAFPAKSKGAGGGGLSPRPFTGCCDLLSSKPFGRVLMRKCVHHTQTCAPDTVEI